jgi:hypothetical protein
MERRDQDFGNWHLLSLTEFNPRSNMACGLGATNHDGHPVFVNFSIVARVSLRRRD